MICFRSFDRGRPSRPSITRLTGRLDSSRVLASSSCMNSAGSWRLDFGSSTRRTGEDLSDSSRTASSAREHQVLQVDLLLRERLLALLGLRIGRALDVLEHRRAWTRRSGSSVTATCHWPRASSSTVQRARTRRLPRPVSYTARIASGSEVMWPPPGRSGPGTSVEQLVERDRGLADRRDHRPRHFAAGCATECRWPCPRRCPTRR